MPAPRDGKDVPDAKARAEAMLEMRLELEARCREATAVQRKYAARKSKPRDYSAGDMVWLSGKNIRTKRLCKKLDFKYHGPFKVLEPIGKQAYRLELPDTMKIHLVFHVSLLEPYNSRAGDADPPPPTIVDDDLEYVVEEILDSRYKWNKL